VSEQNSTAKDYALAKYLNERVAAIFALVADNYKYVSDPTNINRSYVLLVHELKQLYERNPKLSGIRENICWRTFDTLDAMDPYDLYEYSDDYINHGIQHISQVNSLCIIAGEEEPDISPELQKVLDEAGKNVNTLITELDEAQKQRESNIKGWFIPEYNLTYDEMRGIIKINGVYQLNKRSTNDGSNIDKLLKQALAKPNESFIPQLNDTQKNLSTILSNAGFDITLRQLFFPTARKGKGIFCRPVVSRTVVDDESIDTTDLDLKLKEAGATTKPVSSL
jgi:hypothetical protein